MLPLSQTATCTVYTHVYTWWPWCRHWQSAVAVRTGGRRVSQWLLPATATPTARQIYVSRGRKDAGPGIHFVSLGLLQLAVYGIADGLMSRAARLVLGAWRYDHIMLVLQELHWLPVWRRMEFKIATLVYLTLSGMAPAYLAANCHLVSDEGRLLLHSATSRTFVVRRTYSNYGDRCFAAAGPRLWNSLPADLRQADIRFEQFKRLLKTFLFGCWDRGALWLTVNLRLINSLTYLLTYLLTYVLFW